MNLTIKQNILTKNDCYKSTRQRNDTNSVEVHSIGTAQNSASALASYWNQSGVSACVHYCVDAETEGLVYQFLPESKRTWADGGYGNNNSITFEVMESDFMRYTSGANYEVINMSKFIQDIRRGYNTAVALTAKICKEHNWNPQEKMSNGLHRVYSHNEARALGLATSHVDPDHIWKKINKTMDNFRADVAAELGSKIVETAPAQTYYRVRKTWEDTKSQLGAYTSLDNAKSNCPIGYSVYDENGKSLYTPETKSVSTEKLTAKDLNGLSEAEKIATVAPIYQKVYKETGMLASVGLVQFCLESGYGTTDLAQNANNMHGMKCSLSGNTWTGSTWDGKSKYTKKTAEQTTSGSVYYVTADFRKYPTILDSVYDRAAYYKGAMNGSARRYPNIENITDCKKQIEAIKTGGYATDVNYVSKLWNIVTRFNLTQYDTGITPTVVKEEKTTTTKMYRCQAGAYSKKENAQKQVKTIKTKTGFDSFIELQNSNYIVICGSFSKKENCEERIQKLKNKGINAIMK